MDQEKFIEVIVEAINKLAVQIGLLDMTMQEGFGEVESRLEKLESDLPGMVSELISKRHPELFPHS